ncbi:MAG: hypothetical protein DWP95_01120 [Proteobacteria bacterium]|nr:MAG: hypothetical protein DWP95_01120 [Pseudomonadota bacterium]
MKLSITTENKLGITDDILALLKAQQADLKKLEVEDGKVYLQTQQLDKATQGTLASQIMRVPGVKWVNQIDVLPGVATQQMLASLMQVMPDPVLGVNSKGQIAYANSAAEQRFNINLSGSKPVPMHDVFTQSGWQEKLNAAAESKLPVNIETVGGTLLLEVQAIKAAGEKPVAAMLLFRDHEKIQASSYVVQGEQIDGLKNLVYNSDSFGQTVQKAKRVAVVDAPINIVGEPGTGKTLLAHACHSLSDRGHHMFTVIDCQAMKAEPMEQLLFGRNNRPGVLDLNREGTVFFSHVEFMPDHVQQKLSRFFNQDDKNNARIMTSSAKRLGQYQESGQMNSRWVELINVLRLNVLPLRERLPDIEPLAVYFLQQMNREMGRNTILNDDALSKMKRYYWPGNVSQLRQCLYKAVMVNRSGEITATDLDLDAAVSLSTELENLSLQEAVDEFEKQFMQHWYQKYPSTRKLARQLGVSHTTVAQKIKKHNLKLN